MTSLELTVLVAAVLRTGMPLGATMGHAMDAAQELVEEAERRWYKARGLTGPDDPRATQYIGYPR